MKLRGLRQARQRRGLSISQLADLTDLKRETITHLEHGKEEPQAYMMRRLGAALDATTAELVGVSVLESSAATLHHHGDSGSSGPVIAAS